MNWLAHWLGTDNLSGPIYGFWSGFGSDISELGILGALLSHARAFNCEVHGCWRPGHRTTAAGHRVCGKHGKPLGKLTHHHLMRLHHEALADSTQTTSTDGD